MDKLLFVLLISTLSNVLDVPFHKKMITTLEPILSRPFYKNDNGGKLGYYRGPPKGTSRMEVKIFDPDYQKEEYPASACLIDSIRGTVCVTTAEEISEAFNLIEKNFKLCRVKNKYQRDVPFNNLMVNVMFEYCGVELVGEVQITTFVSLDLKTLQHKFYDIIRCFNNPKEIAEGEHMDAAVAEEAYNKILSSVVK